MKTLHRPDLLLWSHFDEDRNIDFNSVLWVRPSGNVVFDPLPATDHDMRHLASLGPVAAILISNSDHTRDALAFAELTGAEIYGPRAEKDTFPIVCDHWLSDGDEPFPGLLTYALDGSKTPGELAFVLDGTTLFTGDLIRAHAAGSLTLLPPDKLSSPEDTKASLARLLGETHIEAVLVGDGWPVFREGHLRLTELYEAH
ncbi:MAG: MBL fold metallo-hydrolase [Myxococcota bacterium]|nr:MBL fold metallo-hydrolase [Myxococcota bacterium]